MKPLFEAYCQLNGELQSTCMVHVSLNRNYFSGLLDAMPPTPKLTPTQTAPATPANAAAAHPPAAATVAAAATTAAHPLQPQKSQQP